MRSNISALFATCFLLLPACDDDDDTNDVAAETTTGTGADSETGATTADSDPAEPSEGGIDTDAQATSDSESDTGGGDPAEETGDGDDPPFGSDEDVDRALDLWARMEGYEAWDSFPNLDGFQPSAAPHGAFVRLFINDIAAANLAEAPAGSIVIKENYGEEDEAALGAITVMERIEGYSPDAGDWFWARFSPDGSIDPNDDGVPLAGRIGLGGDAGCIPCHAGAGDDYLFLN